MAGGIGGEGTMRKILHINPDAKIIVVSGYSNNLIMANYKKYGFRAAISKPFKLNTLNNIVNSLLS